MTATDGTGGSESISTITDFLKLKAKPSKKHVPTNLQLQLALLWRTLRVLRYNDDMHTIVRSFFDDLLGKVKALPSLSLSTSWSSSANGGAGEPSCSSGGSKPTPDKRSSDSYIGIPDNASGYTQSIFLNAIELNYLHCNQDYGDDDLIHDPLGAVCKILESAEGFAMSVPAQEQGVPLSLCLALSVKSGRLPLLLHTISCLVFSDGDYCDIDIGLVRDVQDYVQKLISTSKSASVSVDGFKSKSISQNSNIFYSKNRCYLDMFSPTATRMKKLLLNAPSASSSGSSARGGIIVSFGKADQGKLGHGDTQINRLIPTLIEQLENVSIVKVVSMSTNAMAIDRNGSLYLWGSGGSVIMSHGTRIELVPGRFDLLPNCRVIDISCGLAHALFLTSDHKVYSRGNGKSCHPVGLTACPNQSIINQVATVGWALATPQTASSRSWCRRCRENAS